MFARWLSSLVVLALFVPSGLRADEDKKPQKEPTLVLSVKSLHDLLADAKHVAKVIDKSDEADQIDAFIKEKLGEEGLEAIDVKRPMGLYGFLEESVVDSVVVLLVPVSSEKSFLALLKNFELEPEKDEDGIYTLAPDGLPFELFFRVANKYAYITLRDKACLDAKTLLEPAQVLGKQQSSAALTFRLDQVPDDLKKIFLTQLDLKLEESEEKLPGEDDVQHQARVQAQKGMAKQLAWVVKEGKEIGARFDIDRAKNEIVAEWKLSGTEKSSLAKSIKELAQAQSLFANLRGDDSAAAAVIHGTVPDYIRDTFAKAFKEGFEKDLSKKDEATQQQLKALYECIEPTLKSGDVDTFATFRGPTKDHKYTALAGMRVVDGHKLEKALKKLVADMPDKKKREQIEFDVAGEGDLHVHKLTDPKGLRGDARRLFGDSSIFVGFRKDCMLVAVGPEALDLLKSAASAKKEACPPVEVRASLSRLLWVMGKVDDDQAKDMLDRSFGDKEGADRIRFVMEGGDALTARLDIKLPVLRFMNEFAEARKEARKSRSQNE